MTLLNKEQLERFHRNILLKGMGEAGQKKLLEAKVLIIGTGGLGSPAALYLAAAGVGTLGLVDSDKVELSNLQRQIIHFTTDTGQIKVKSASQKLKQLNPDAKISLYHTRLTTENIADVIKNYDFVLDCTDNFDSKFLINDACLKSQIPFSHAGVSSFQGQTMTILPGQSACYRCFFAEPPAPGEVPSTAEVGILGPVAGLLGIVQATEAIKYLTKTGTLLTDTILTYNALDMHFRKIKIRPNPTCPSCLSK